MAKFYQWKDVTREVTSSIPKYDTGTNEPIMEEVQEPILDGLGQPVLNDSKEPTYNTIKRQVYETVINTVTTTEWVLDEQSYNAWVEEQNNLKNKEQLLDKINILKEQLGSTDYKIIKCFECQLSNQELPYDIQQLHEERQVIRDKINQLENTMG
jgi:hypothetical protein